MDPQRAFWRIVSLSYTGSVGLKNASSLPREYRAKVRGSQGASVSLECFMMLHAAVSSSACTGAEADRWELPSEKVRN